MEYPYPIAYYTDNSAKPLLFHLLDVGEGLMALIVLPDQTTVLYDCNVRQEHKTEIINYLKTNIPYRYDRKTKGIKQWIDIFINS